MSKQLPNDITPAPVMQVATLKNPDILQAEEQPENIFPVAALPQLLQQTVEAIHDITQAPVAMCAISTIAAINIAVQGYGDVYHPFEHKAKPISLNLACIGESGERKSTVDNHTFEALREHQTRLRYRYEEAKNSGTTGNLLEPYFLISDFTAESVFLKLYKGHPVMAVMTSEGGKVTGGHGMDKDKLLYSATCLSSLWDSGSGDRIHSTVESFFSNGKRFSIYFQIQPDAAMRFFINPVLRDQGLHSRLLAGYPKSRVGERIIRSDPKPESFQAKEAFSGRLNDILKTSLPINPEMNGSLKPKVLELEPNAKTRLVAFENYLEPRRAEGQVHQSIRDISGKAPENACRMAATFTLSHNLESNVITLDALESAITIVEYFLEEALRLRHQAAGDQLVQQAVRLYRWLLDSWLPENGKTITLPMLQRRCPLALRSLRSKGLRRLLEYLAQDGLVKPPDKPNASPEIWTIIDQRALALTPCDSSDSC